MSKNNTKDGIPKFANDHGISIDEAAQMLKKLNGGVSVTDAGRELRRVLKTLVMEPACKCEIERLRAEFAKAQKKQVEQISASIASDINAIAFYAALIAEFFKTEEDLFCLQSWLCGSSRYPETFAEIVEDALSKKRTHSGMKELDNA